MHVQCILRLIDDTVSQKAESQFMTFFLVSVLLYDTYCYLLLPALRYIAQPLLICYMIGCEDVAKSSTGGFA
jgi:hypothetical protein